MKSLTFRLLQVLMGTLALVLAGACANWSGEGVTQLSEAPDFHAGSLLELEPYGEFDPGHHFDKPFLVLLYFSELSCTTCTSQAVTDLVGFHERYGDHADFFLVVHGHDPVYLANLRRVGRVRFPILLEATRGQLGFSDTTMALVDTTLEKLMALYRPNPSSDSRDQLKKFANVLRLKLANGHASSADEHLRSGSSL